MDEADDIDDAHLDESARLYLKSYKESYSRRKPYPVGYFLALIFNTAIFDTAHNLAICSDANVAHRQIEVE